MSPITKRSDIEVAIICALPEEARAVKAILQEIENFGDGADSTARKSSEDYYNACTVGEIASFPVVLAHMPTIPGLNLHYFVGICGGVPNEAEHPKRTLGDVIVGTHMIQYDFGKRDADGFNPKSGPESAFNQQTPEVRAFISKIESKRKPLAEKTEKYFKALLDESLSKDLGGLTRFRDSLYSADYWHMHHIIEKCRDGKCSEASEICGQAKTLSCEELQCEEDQRIRTNYLTISNFKPDIHFGVVASGDMVMKSGEERDRLAEKYNAIAFDMEGAGIWNTSPCLIIKGISDYADSHKNNMWRDIAAHSAAACAKAVVEQWHLADQSVESAKETRVQNVHIRDRATVGFVSQDTKMRDFTFSVHQVNGQKDRDID